MVYTEWLRIRAALKWTAIVLGFFLAVCGIARLATFRYDAMHFVHSIQTDPDSRTTATTLSDGTKETVVVNARKQIRITIDDRGYDGERVDVIDQSPTGDKHDNLSMGSLSVRSLPAGRGEETIIETNDASFVGDFTIVALVISLIFATILGAPFAKENDGHLEIALTKPVGRYELALKTMLADCGGIAASYALGLLFAIAFHAIFQSLKMRVTPLDVFSLAVGLVSPIAWYAMLNALTASMKRAYGVMLGLAWPLAGGILLIAALPAGNMVRDLLRSTIGLLAYLVPLKYMNASSIDYPNLVTLVVLALVYGTLAAIQWRRVEA